MESIILVSLGSLVSGILGVWWYGVRFIPNSKVGIVEKLWSRKGSLKDQIIALNGEAGYQPEVIRGGIHFLSRLQYRVHVFPLVTVSQGQMGYVFARDGKPLDPAQTLGRVTPEGRTFQDVRAFLAHGGQRGPQREIIREGTYAFNLAQFLVITGSRIYSLPMEKGEANRIQNMATLLEQRQGFEPIVIHGQDDQVGIVTVHDGASLDPGAIIAPTVGADPAVAEHFHNNFQNPEAFLKAGGQRGRQHQVIVDGTYYINRLFATVELIPKTVVEVGFVGVVISYIGLQGDDTSGLDYKHGELVARGHKGVWSEPLLPGKYAFNTYAGKIILVPTTNIVLKWVNNVVGGHKYDENLMAVDLITQDAFEPSLPLSVVIHIDYRKAPRVIQRFGHVKKLVEQTLDPMVSAFFKNIGQKRTLIELIQERSEIQQTSHDEMKQRFAHYDLELEEVLIGTPMPSDRDNRIEHILTQLRDRQIAMEQVETYAMQEKAAVQERQLKEAQAKAQQQPRLTESEILVDIKGNEGEAEYRRSQQEAKRIRTLAAANAEQEARLGVARSIAVEELVRAYGGPEYQVTQQVLNRFSEAIEHSGVDIVPRLVMSSGGGTEQGHSAFEALLASLLSDRYGLRSQERAPSSTARRSEQVEQLRKELLEAIPEPAPLTSAHRVQKVVPPDREAKRASASGTSRSASGRGAAEPRSAARDPKAAPERKGSKPKGEVATTKPPSGRRTARPLTRRSTPRRASRSPSAEEGSPEAGNGTKHGSRMSEALRAEAGPATRGGSTKVQGPAAQPRSRKGAAEKGSELDWG